MCFNGKTNHIQPQQKIHQFFWWFPRPPTCPAVGPAPTAVAPRCRWIRLD
jgi:hypothetical protein